MTQGRASRTPPTGDGPAGPPVVSRLASASFAVWFPFFRWLVSRVPSDAFDQPGLGVWDVRGLIGHTSRAMSTVITYLKMPATSVTCPDESRPATAQPMLASEPVAKAAMSTKASNQ